ncbi:MAG: hypothetical protein KF790_09700 [Steroidobacteraceae bacterium]|nr:hypothetical protein [Steroidobacteraceae bacterium]
MDDSRDVDALIARIVRDARIPWRRAREDLRRELGSHFEAAGDTRAALRAFGDEAELVDELRRVYRRDYLMVCAAKVLVSVVVTLAVALALQLLVSLRFGGTATLLHLSAGFRMSAATATAMAVCLVATWEFARRPFEDWLAPGAMAFYVGLVLLAVMVYGFGGATVLWSVVLLGLGSLCHRLSWRKARLPLTVLVFALAIGALHGTENATVDFLRALVAGAGLAAIWRSTPAVLDRIDQLFAHRFGLNHGEP